MHKLLEGVSVEGVIMPGEVYVFSEHEDRLSGIDGPDIAYTILSEKELMIALEMEVGTVIAEFRKINEFIGWEKLSDDCYCFRLACEPDEFFIGGIYSFYLHRMIKLNERLEWVNNNYGQEEDSLYEWMSE